MISVAILLFVLPILALSYLHDFYQFSNKRKVDKNRWVYYSQEGYTRIAAVHVCGFVLCGHGKGELYASCIRHEDRCNSLPHHLWPRRPGISEILGV